MPERFEIAQLLVNPAAENPEPYELKVGVTTLGRGRENDVVVAHASLSRRHATIEHLVDRFLLTDLESRNGSFVNGVRIDRIELRHGDEIKLGDVPMAFLVGSSRLRQVPAAVRRLRLGDLVAAEPVAVSGSSLLIPARDPDARLKARLEILLEVTRLLSTPMELPELLGQIVDLLGQILKFDRAAILVKEPDGELRPLVTRPAGTEGGYSRAVVGRVLESRSSILSVDTLGDERFEAGESIRAQSIRAVMAAPLLVKDDVMGVLYVDSQRSEHTFADEDLDFLAGFAGQASLALENEALRRRLQDLAVRKSSMARFFPPAAIARLEESGGLRLGVSETPATILFSDISGFTDMSSRMAPREVVGLLNDYFPTMAEIVFRHGGTLEKYIGDALLAVWGAPFSTGRDAEHAVRAAIDMLRALDRLNAAWEAEGRPRLDVHVGVNTGTVAAGNIGSEAYLQYATIGDATNVAARICSVAGPGELIVAAATAEALGETDLVLTQLPPATVKGKAEPLSLARVEWRKTAASGA